MSLTLVSNEPCWQIPGFDGDGCEVAYHIAGGRAAAEKRAAELRSDWTDEQRPMVATQDTVLCWTGFCDVCGWRYHEELAPAAHVPGDAAGPDTTVLAGHLVERDRVVYCSECDLAALSVTGLPSSHPKAQIPGQGELLGTAG